MHGGPWLFRNQSVVIEEYDGLTNTKSLQLDSLRIWVRIMGLPDLLRNEPVAKMLVSKMGEVLEVELGINGVEYGKFVRVRLKIKIAKPLLRFVSRNVEVGKPAQKFRVLYEKMPRFCANCGTIGHIADQCGDGLHDPSKFQYGDFMMVPQEEFLFQPRQVFVAVPGASSMCGRGTRSGSGGGRGNRSESQSGGANGGVPSS